MESDCGSVTKSMEMKFLIRFNDKMGNLGIVAFSRWVNLLNWKLSVEIKMWDDEKYD